MHYAPDIVQAMLRASAAAGVGPMAAVAGAVAEYTGREILKSCDEVIVENGGDIFLKVNRDVTHQYICRCISAEQPDWHKNKPAKQRLGSLYFFWNGWPVPEPW